MREVFPEARIIHIVRDGRDVACSMVPGCGGERWLHLKPPSWKRLFREYQGAVRCALAWKEIMEIALQDLGEIPHLQIRYEDLVREPRAIAREILNYLDLDDAPEVMDFCRRIQDSTSDSYHAQYQVAWYRPDHSRRIGRYRENLTPEEQGVIEEILSPLLVRLGYVGEVENTAAATAVGQGSRSAKTTVAHGGRAEAPKRLGVYVYRPGRDFRWPLQWPCRVPAWRAVGSSSGLASEIPRSLTSPADGHSAIPRVVPLIDSETGQLLEPQLYHLCDSPEEADCLLFPFYLDPFINLLGMDRVKEMIKGLPHFAGRESSHVFWTNYDDPRPFDLPCVFFRASTDVRRKDERAIPVPYETEDLGRLSGADFASLPYDTSFVGFSGRTGLRQLIAEGVTKTPELKALVKLRRQFWRHVRSAEQRTEYLESLAASRTVLCPRGAGTGSIRFFEVLSAGRIPVLISDDYELPFADVIDYERFIVRFSEREAPLVGRKLFEWLQSHSMEALQEMGRLGREAWVKHLKVSNWPRQVYDYLIASRRLHSHLTRVARAGREAPRQGAREGGGGGDGAAVVAAGVCAAVVADGEGRRALLQVDGIEGHLLPGDVKFLYERAKSLPQNGTIVEIGSFMGLSAVVMAKGLAASGNQGARIYCVDTWEGSPVHQQWRVVKEGKLFDVFMQNIRKAGVSSYIHPLPGRSVERAVDFADHSVDLLFVDGDHSYEGC
ncbi:MAG: exostosin domain-containing protein, partial [Candidatus Thorarchaeota archaeon]